MTEVFGDLWEAAKDADALCITTNGSLVKLQGGLVRGVMGRGLAWQAKQRNPNIEQVLGEQISQFGNHVHVLQTSMSTREPTRYLLSFPVKHLWMEHADLQLIARSAHELVAAADKGGWQTVLLPRPGCGNGGLRWETVQPIIAPILDDRFVVMDYAPRSQ